MLSLKFYKMTYVIGVVLILFPIFNFFKNIINNEMNDLITFPSFTAFAYMFFWVYDKYIWKWFPVLTKAPRIFGRYTGKLKSKISKENIEERSIAIEIVQTSSLIYIKQYTKAINSEENSISHSLYSDIKVTEDNNVEIYFYYENEGNPLTLHSVIHRGFCRLVLNMRDKSLNGKYFTEREEPTCGTIETKKTSDKTTGGFHG